MPCTFWFDFVSVIAQLAANAKDACSTTSLANITCQLYTKAALAALAAPAAPEIKV